ncbi:MAG: TlpA family protein disulfide reductase [Blastocatellia bacterium]
MSEEPGKSAKSKLRILLLIFLVSFAGFYFYWRKRPVPDPPQRQLLAAVGKPFPEARLVSLDGSYLSAETLRHGKIIVVFLSSDCDYCLNEGKFLGQLITRGYDVSFLGVFPYGKDKSVLAGATDNFPFPVYFDQSAGLGRTLGIDRVPIKIFLQDGIIRKVWTISSSYEDEGSKFSGWLEAESHQGSSGGFGN